jgi:hypothetical protein
MPIATKNNAIIVKDGKLAENCECCGGWYCDSVCQEVTRRGLTVSVSLENVTPVGIDPLIKVDASKGYLDDLGGVAFPVLLTAPTSPDLSLDRWPSMVVKTNAGLSGSALYYEKGDDYKLSRHCERYCYILYGYSQTVSGALSAGASGGPMPALGVTVPSFECTMTMSLNAASATFIGHYAGQMNVSGYAGNAGIVFSTTVPFSPSGFSTRRDAVACPDIFTPSRMWLCDIVITTTSA